MQHDIKSTRQEAGELSFEALKVSPQWLRCYALSLRKVLCDWSILPEVSSWGSGLARIMGSGVAVCIKAAFCKGLNLPLEVFCKLPYVLFEEFDGNLNQDACP